MLFADKSPDVNDNRRDSSYAMANQMRIDVLEMMGIGNAGHLGGSISLAEIVAALYFDVMKFSPKKISDSDRDRFILSKGHSVLIQYATLVELGIIPRSELEKTKTLEGILQGHPDMKTPGMESVTESLGQGLSIGIGNIVGILDRNGIQSSSRTADVFAIPGLEDKWKAF